MFWNSFENLSRKLLFLDRACAIDAYKCNRRWKIHVAPWARCPSFPVSFWATKTVICFLPGCQVLFKSNRTLRTRVSEIPTVSMYVFIMRPSIIWTCPTIRSSYLSILRGHCLTVVSGSLITKKMALISAANSINICSLECP